MENSINNEPEVVARIRHLTVSRSGDVPNHWPDFIKAYDEVVAKREIYKQLAIDERAALMKASMRLTEAQKVAAFFASVIKSGEGWSDTCQEMLDSI